MSERRGIAGHGVRSGTLTGGLPYLAQGSGPPLVVLAGLGKDNAHPHGLQRRFELGTVRPYADAGRTAYWVTRRPGLAAGVTMADLAADHAVALRAEFGEPVDILGFSTGGSVAQQLAVDHPDVVRRLVLACTAYRLGTAGRATQRRLRSLPPPVTVAPRRGCPLRSSAARRCPASGGAFSAGWSDRWWWRATRPT